MKTLSFAKELFSVALLFSCLTACSKDGATAYASSIPENTDLLDNGGSSPTAYPQLINRTTAYPASYATVAERRGTVEELTYNTRDYVNGNEAAERTNNAYVYLPYGYTLERKYNILYLVHGHYGDASTFLSIENGLLRNVLDHMIAQGDIDPMIVVTPTYNYGSPTANYVDAGPYCRALPEELHRDLIPLVESRYSTYATATDDEGIAASRDHRAIGGFSMGGVTTWFAFDERMSDYRFFLPFSGDCWSLGSFQGQNNPTATTNYLVRRIDEQGFTPHDFYIWAAAGTSDSAYGEILSQVRGMSARSDVFPLSNLTFHEKAGARHEYAPMVEYLYNALPFLFPPSATTAVRSIRTNTSRKYAVYNLAGQKIAVSDTSHGLYIIDGRKIIK